MQEEKKEKEKEKGVSIKLRTFVAVRLTPTKMKQIFPWSYQMSRFITPMQLYSDISQKIVFSDKKPPFVTDKRVCFKIQSTKLVTQVVFNSEPAAYSTDLLVF